MIYNVVYSVREHHIHLGGVQCDGGDWMTAFCGPRRPVMRFKTATRRSLSASQEDTMPLCS